MKANTNPSLVDRLNEGQTLPQYCVDVFDTVSEIIHQADEIMDEVGQARSAQQQIKTLYLTNPYFRTGAILKCFSPADMELEALIEQYNHWEKAATDFEVWQAERDQQYYLNWTGL